MTIKDIARESGYAVSTVSRALNDHPDVSAETKARIQAVIDAHGFIPNNNAKHLKQTATKSIAIVVKGTSNMLFAPIVERMQDLIKSAGYTDVVYYLDEDSDEVRHALLLCPGAPFPRREPLLFPRELQPHPRPQRARHQPGRGARLSEPVERVDRRRGRGGPRGRLPDRPRAHEDRRDRRRRRALLYEPAPPRGVPAQLRGARGLLRAGKAVRESALRLRERLPRDGPAARPGARAHRRLRDERRDGRGRRPRPPRPGA